MRCRHKRSASITARYHPTRGLFARPGGHHCRSQHSDIAVNVIRFTKAVKGFLVSRPHDLFAVAEKAKMSICCGGFENGACPPAHLTWTSNTRLLILQLLYQH